jgi:hypothetical protein
MSSNSNIIQTTINKNKWKSYQKLYSIIKKKNPKIKSKHIKKNISKHNT